MTIWHSKAGNFRAPWMFFLIGCLLALLASGPVSEGAAPAKPEAAKPEAAKPEAAKPEAAKPEAPKPKAAKPKAAKPEAAKQLPGFGKYRVVRVDREGIFPQAVTVAPGTTVIWFNATDRFSSMVFNEGNLLRNSTKAPTLFFLASDGTFISSAIEPGATASLAFVRPGTYNYFITGLEISGGGAFARVIVK
ncbi:MAG: hypothetical protein O2807_05020 [bacterium]|nr:hypothetical protein [bacterium]